MNRTDPFDGILLVDKPAGPTSHDIVARIRHHFQLKKVGHGGTLDPSATGLLIVLLGRGTSASNRFMSSDKTYEGSIHLGITTDSQDADGQILSETDATAVTREQLETAMARFKGDMYQTPPMVSAVKIAGVPLYKLARRGEEVERKPRFIHVYSFRLLDYAAPEGRFQLRCSKGTYVRTLCHDVGAALGVGAHLRHLRRTESGGYDVEQAIPFDALFAMSQIDLLKVVLPLHTLTLRGGTSEP